jgi:hypothetical protein
MGMTSRFHDLRRPEHQALPRETVHHDLPVALPVVAGDHPGREVVFPPRRERRHDDVFLLRLPRQLQDDVPQEAVAPLLAPR